MGVLHLKYVYGSVSAIVAATLLSACGEAPPPDEPDMATPPDLVPGYPVGPYGAEVGSTLPNFTFEGYWSPTKTAGLATAEPFGEITFDRVRTSGAKYALLHLTAFWCGPCQIAARAMAAKAPTFVPKGGFLMGTLTEGRTPSDIATKANLDAWIANARVAHTYTLDSVDPQDPLELFFGVPRDTFVIVDLKTMKIVEIVDGLSGGSATAFGDFEALLDQAQ